MRTTWWIGIALAMLAVPAAGFRSRDDSVKIESPALTHVAEEVASGQRGAVERFWADARTKGTPLVERVDRDPAHVLATFVWRGRDTTNDVVLMADVDGIAPMRDARSHLLHLPDTDIWYRSHIVPATAEFSYLFAENPVAGDI